MKSTKWFVRGGAAAAVGILMAPLFSQADKTVRSVAGEVVWGWVGRGVLTATGSGEVYGYLPLVNGISGPMFAGAPGEAGAYLTFRSGIFQLQPLPPNGDVGLSMGPAGKFDVYFTANPRHAGLP